MKPFIIYIELIALTMLMSLNFACGNEVYAPLSLDFREERLRGIEDQIDRRWKKLRMQKNGYFSTYKNRNNEEIIKEFNNLDNFRRHLWYRNPEQMPYTSNPDYKFHIPLNTSNQSHKKRPVLPFNYNCADDFYSASTILLFGHHFIALREPMNETLDTFFKVLINHEVGMLVRLKPEGEYKEKGSLNYWEDKMIEGTNYLKISQGTAIPYHYTNNWVDNKGIDLDELYELVQSVRTIYREAERDGPIACHCAAGVGRTGTFIAAYVLAEMLDFLHIKDISIESLVLKLSIQRPEMVYNEEQYLLLYRFADYYMDQKDYYKDNYTKTNDL